MFQSCDKITEVNGLDTAKGTNFKQMFYNCKNLITIGNLDLSNGQNFYNMFYGCNNLTNVSFKEGSIKYSISFQHSSKLSKDSINSIKNSLLQIESGQPKPTLTLNNNIQLTETEIAEVAEAVTGKNWNLAWYG